MVQLPPENDSFLRIYTQRRYIIAYMLLLGTAVMYIVRTNLSVAIVSMSKEFGWSSTDQGLVLSSFFYGYILTQMPGGALSKRFPSHLVFAIAIGLSSVLTLVTPLTKGSLVGIIVIRVLEGIALGVTFPAMMALISHWAPPLERSRITMIANTGIHVGTVIALVGSGFLNDYLGYESIFYVFGSFGILWFISWLIIVRERPDNDRWISEREKKYLTENIITSGQSTSLFDVPWISMLLSVPVWALVIAHTTFTWGADTLLTQMPTFLSDTLNLELSVTGFYSCLPYITTGILSIPAGAFADFLISRNILSTIHARKIFTCLGYVIQSGVMLLSTFFMTPVGSILCLIIAVGFQAVTQSGYGVNYLDIAPQYSGIIFGFTNVFGTLSGILSPILTGVIVQNQSKEEWKYVFYIAAGVYLVGAFLYAMFASSDLQKWAEVTENKDAANKERI